MNSKAMVVSRRVELANGRGVAVLGGAEPEAVQQVWLRRAPGRCVVGFDVFTIVGWR